MVTTIVLCYYKPSWHAVIKPSCHAATKSYYTAVNPSFHVATNPSYHVATKPSCRTVTNTFYYIFFQNKQFKLSPTKTRKVLTSLLRGGEYIVIYSIN